MSVADDLPRLCPASSETHAINDVIEAPLEQRQHIVAGDALHHGGLFEVVPKLSFKNAVDTPCLLLLAKLQPVSHGLLHFLVLAMLPGNEVALFDSALLGIAALAFEEQLHSFAPA